MADTKTADAVIEPTLEEQISWFTQLIDAFGETPETAPLNRAILRTLRDAAGWERDAWRYRWMRTRINWEDVRRQYGELSTHNREWTHIDMRPKESRPNSEHIDEYIDSFLVTAGEPL